MIAVERFTAKSGWEAVALMPTIDDAIQWTGAMFIDLEMSLDGDYAAVGEAGERETLLAVTVPLNLEQTMLVRALCLGAIERNLDSFMVSLARQVLRIVGE